MSKKTYTLIGLLVLLVILIVLAWKFNILPKGSQNSSKTDQEAAKNVPPPTQKEAQVSGKLTAGMPASLILNSNGTIVDSYKITYPEADQYTTVFNSTKTIGSELVAYENSLTQAGYKTISKSLGQNSGNYYGTKGKAEVNVLVAQNNGEKISTVTVTYLLKK